MNDEDVALFRQAEGLTYSGQTLLAYQMFRDLRDRGNTEVEILFWIIETTPNAIEARQTLDTVQRLQPTHPLIPRMEALHNRKMARGTYVPLTPVLLCPYCRFQGPVIVRDKVSTGGWVLFVVVLLVFFPLCWVGLLIRENYWVCSRCGTRIATAG